jgi:hypothetical protein
MAARDPRAVDVEFARAVDAKIDDMPPTPVASILIPTRGRPSYLDVALASIVPQARSRGAEVLVVNDGGGPSPPRTMCASSRPPARVE